MAKRSHHELLVVDGYNVIFGTPRYEQLIDRPSPRQLDHDPFDRARELLVFDAAGNVNPDHPELRRAGVRMIFSPTGVTADTVIEKLVTDCRHEMRAVTVVTSDNAIRATVGGIPVTRISSSMLAHEIDVLDDDREQARADRSPGRLTVEDLLDAETVAKLNRLLGRK